MFNHIVLGSNDLDASKRFYDAVLGTLGFAGEPFRDAAPSGHERLFYRHNGNVLAITRPINDAPATVSNGATIGFKCNSPEQVLRFHDVAVEHGGTSIESPPGERQFNLGKMHLAYVRDPDGNKLCAIHRPA
ncbi:VOC family protein [Sphingomonas sabuli]|uniref:VOC family protein n=1 Tax=Sphingomonas sabuli TaxID=2764186 RepID=A0A7G9L0R1_9SPHN|nr:VOC family protein [Sphingomonas sabuli]QNM82210.1 VOC family protein [Sphingomonas sabuli]